MARQGECLGIMLGALDEGRQWVGQQDLIVFNAHGVALERRQLPPTRACAIFNVKSREMMRALKRIVDHGAFREARVLVWAQTLNRKDLIRSGDQQHDVPADADIVQAGCIDLVLGGDNLPRSFVEISHTSRRYLRVKP